MLKNGVAAQFQDPLFKRNKVPIRLYSPERSHHEDFLVLFNKLDAKFVMNIGWIDFKLLPATIRNNGDNRHRAGTSRDYGFCGSQNSSAENSATGIPAPRMKEGSTHVNHF